MTVSKSLDLIAKEFSESSPTTRSCLETKSLIFGVTHHFMSHPLDGTSLSRQSPASKEGKRGQLTCVPLIVFR